MGKYAVVGAVFLSVLSARAVMAAEWEQMATASEPGEVATWVRDVEDNPVKEFRGEVELDADAVSVLALLADAGALDEWVFQCDAAERLSGFSHDRIYMRFEAPWPVSSRDVVVENRVSLNGPTMILRSRSAREGKPEQDGLVRIPELDNRFQVTRLDNGHVRVVFQTFVDPGGRVPAWLSNFVATKAPLRTLRGMRELVARQPWRSAELEDLPALPGFEQLDLEAWLQDRDTMPAS